MWGMCGLVSYASGQQPQSHQSDIHCQGTLVPTKGQTVNLLLPHDTTCDINTWP